MKKVVLYSHGGSGNRGCEAIVRGTRKILGENLPNNNFYLCSLNKEEDTEVNIDDFNNIIGYSNYVKRNTIEHLLAVVNNRLFGNTEKYITFAQRNLYKVFDEKTVAVSIGGDNYCYNDSTWLHISHREAKRRHTKTVLWGCSLEADNMNEEMLQDLNNYDLIVARESLTYNLLLNNGIDKNTKLYPDPAFQLGSEAVDFPNGFISGNTIGINLSPYIFKSKLQKNKVLELYAELINHIILTTDMQIALIPHVFWKHNNDLDVLSEIYLRFMESDRVILIEDNYNSMQLKYIISNCRIFIGARTHSTIAAYSTCVPTLVLGYSVKSRGIAKDIFGSEENMVLSVQEIKKKEELIKAYEFIKINEELIKLHLQSFIPTYKEKASLAGKEISNLISSK